MFKILKFFIFILLLFWISGFYYFIILVPKSVKDDTTFTDAIVVFTGSAKRIEEAIRLFKENKANYLIISGLNPKVKSARFLEDPSFFNDSNKDRIIFGYKAANTFENAKETKELVEKYQLKSIRLITSHFHIPRSLFELECVLPKSVIIPHPVFSETNFWAKKNIFFYIKEYHKLLKKYIFYYIKG